MTGLFKHHNHSQTSTTEWLTPKWLLDRLGAFDLDPCSPIERPWDTAKTHFTIQDNGLTKQWFGRVWLNPPFGKRTEQWVCRLADHGDGIALLFCRTETKLWFSSVWGKADGVLFLRGRPTFCYVSGQPAPNNSGAPVALIAFGTENLNTLMGVRDLGALVSEL